MSAPPKTVLEVGPQEAAAIRRAVREAGPEDGRIVAGAEHVAGLTALLADPRVGPAILAWRERGAIPLLAKRLATLLLALSAGVGWFGLPGDWRYLPGSCGALILLWMWSRPSA